MKKKSAFVFLLAAALGCTDTGQGPLDPQQRPPYLRKLTFSPDSVDVDALTPSGGVYTITTQITALITDPDGPADIKKVAFSVFHGSSLLQTGTLSRSPSDTATFTGQTSFTVSRTDIGTYWIDVSPTDQLGSVGNTVRQRLLVAMKNVPPAIKRIGVAFTVSGDSVILEPTAVLSDSNGYSDISTVVIRLRNSSDSTARVMRDDGLGGDATSGDGIFYCSATVKALSGTENIICEVTATDRSGARGIASRAVANRAPVIAGINVPTSIPRPDVGAANYLFQLRASDPDGYNDIDSVYFRNLSSASPSNILMYDDGNIPANGDSVAGDGVFSRIVTIDANTTTGAKTFLFRVVDFSKARADSTRVITIY